MERVDVLRGGGERAPQGAEVGVHERLLVGRNNVRECGKMRAPRGPAVGAQTAARGTKVDVLQGGLGRTSRGA